MSTRPTFGRFPGPDVPMLYTRLRPEGGSNKLAQAGTDRRLVGDAVKPQSDALGRLTMDSVSPERAKLLMRCRPDCCFALSGLRSFYVRLPRAALHGCRRSALPWADLSGPFRPGNCHQGNATPGNYTGRYLCITTRATPQEDGFNHHVLAEGHTH